MSRILKMILALNLTILTVLVFIYPHLMVGPGKLIPGHSELEADCFACHAPLTGVDSLRCVTCHKPQDIGHLDTTGLPIQKPLTTVAFHQELISQDCVACHSDHAGVKRFRQQGHFDHALLQSTMREQCHTCHKIPADTLHRQITGNCSQCHTQEKWSPATFDHNQYFELDRKHNPPCATCHISNDYSRYTCYGCHEHTSENIRRKHIKEGIRDYSNCVECHRNADEHDIRGEYGGKKKNKEGREGRKKKHKDH